MPLTLKEISLVEYRQRLNDLPDGKLLINTINAHSYNTALKDPLFAEALLKGDALIPGRGQYHNSLQVAKHSSKAS